MSRTWHMVNFQAGSNWFEFIVRSLRSVAIPRVSLPYCLLIAGEMIAEFIPFAVWNVNTIVINFNSSIQCEIIKDLINYIYC